MRFGYTRLTSTCFFGGAFALGGVPCFLIDSFLAGYAALLPRPNVHLIVSVIETADWANQDIVQPSFDFLLGTP